MKILNEIDIFGYRTSFLIFNGHSFHTNVSISLTLLILLISILLIYFLGHDFIYRKNPLTLESTANRDYLYILNLTTNDYISAWRIEDYLGNEVNVTNLLYPVLSHYDSDTKEYHRMESKKCSEIQLNDNNLKGKINEYNCFNWNTSKFGGSWDDSELFYFSFSLLLCDESGKNCADTNELNNLLKKEIYISLYYPYINFNPENIEQAYQIVYNEYYSIISPKLMKVDKIKIHHTLVLDDKNFFYTHFNNHSLWASSQIESAYYMFDSGDNSLYTLNFYMDKEYTLYKRTFTKLQETLTIVSTFIKLIFIFFKLIAEYYNKIFLYKNLAEKSFSLSSIEPQSNKTFGNSNMLNNSSSNKLNNFMDNTIRGMFSTKIKKNGNKIHFSTKFMLVYLFSCNKLKSHKSELYNKAKKNLQHKIDLMTYLRTMKEIEYIKQYLFTDIQLKQINENKKEPLLDASPATNPILPPQSKTISNFTFSEIYNNNNISN